MDRIEVRWAGPVDLYGCYVTRFVDGPRFLGHFVTNDEFWLFRVGQEMKFKVDLRRLSRQLESQPKILDRLIQASETFIVSTVWPGQVAETILNRLIGEKFSLYGLGGFKYGRLIWEGDQGIYFLLIERLHGDTINVEFNASWVDFIDGANIYISSEKAVAQ